MVWLGCEEREHRLVDVDGESAECEDVGADVEFARTRMWMHGAVVRRWQRGEE